MTMNQSATESVEVETSEEKTLTAEALQHLLESCPGSEGALVVTSDGFVVSSILTGEIAVRGLAALTSSILGLAESLSSASNQGVCQNLVVEAENGNILALRINKTRILTVIAKHSTSLGMLLRMSKQCIKQLTNIDQV